MPYPLTHRADQLLRFIEAYIASNAGIAPTFEEMRAHLGLNSKSGIDRLLGQLEERGRIHRMPCRPRCIEIVRELPRSAEPAFCAEDRVIVRTAMDRALHGRLSALAARAGLTVSDFTAQALERVVEGRERMGASAASLPNVTSPYA